MSHGPEHHLEEAEHVPHLAHDPFDRRVAMTMAIVAAGLACVAMLSHRAHTETLRFQTQADIHHTKASDAWSYYQAKKNRQYMNENDANLLQMLAPDSGGKSRGEIAELRRQWTGKAADYRKDADKLEEEARGLQERARELEGESDHAHHLGNRYDLAELGVQLALVLCSLAVLTKQRGFWYAGVSLGVVGVLVAVSGFLGIGLH
jgi:hypothetical protein